MTDPATTEVHKLVGWGIETLRDGQWCGVSTPGFDREKVRFWLGLRREARPDMQYRLVKITTTMVTEVDNEEDVDDTA